MLRLEYGTQFTPVAGADGSHDACLLNAWRFSASNLDADDARTTVRVVQSRTVFVHGYQCPCQFLRGLLDNLTAALNCAWIQT